MGYIVDPDTLTVTFVGTGASGPEARQRVAFPDGIEGAPVLEQPTAPAPLDARDTAMVVARQTAAGQPFMICSDRYNTVVLPASTVGKNGWLVYLLAATTKPGVVVFGGHHRFLITPDGRSALEHQPLSRSCLTSPPPEMPPGARLESSFVTHLVTDTPTEVHVFLSLSHRLPIVVGVAHRNELWRVEGRRIGYLGRRL
jgi:hypothetical protein